MKIAFVSRKFFPYGGTTVNFHRIMSALVAQGHEVHIYANSWEPTDMVKGAHFHKVRMIGSPPVLRDLSFACFLSRALKSEQYDAIHSYDYTLQPDIIYHVGGSHWGWLKERWRWIGLPRKISVLLNPYNYVRLWFERRMFRQRKYRALIAESKLTVEELNNYYGVPCEEARVIYNGLDLESFLAKKDDQGCIRDAYGISKDDTVILFVGSSFKRKGLPFILKAMNLIPEPLTLLIVGKGRPMDFSDRFGNKRVVFCGHRKNVSDFFSIAKIFVLPSIYEPFGIAALEAMAYGIPVIVSRQCGISEIIEHGKEGYVLVEPDDVEAMAKHIRSLLDTGVRMAMSAHASALAKGRSIEQFVDEVFNFYKDLYVRSQGGSVTNKT